jgi:hypothetical protein
MLQSGHSPEWMTVKMQRQIHFVFSVVEAIIDIPRRQDQTCDLDEGTPWKPEQCDVRHLISPNRSFEQPSESNSALKEANPVQSLGGMPCSDRASAIARLLICVLTVNDVELH